MKSISQSYEVIFTEINWNDARAPFIEEIEFDKMLVTMHKCTYNDIVCAVTTFAAKYNLSFECHDKIEWSVCSEENPNNLFVNKIKINLSVNN